jgi:hypothetical protein
MKFVTLDALPCKNFFSLTMIFKNSLLREYERIISVLIDFKNQKPTTEILQLFEKTYGIIKHYVHISYDKN